MKEVVRPVTSFLKNRVPENDVIIRGVAAKFVLGGPSKNLINPVSFFRTFHR